MLDEYPLFLTW